MWDFLAVALAVLSYALLILGTSALWPLVGDRWTPATRPEDPERGAEGLASTGADPQPPPFDGPRSTA
jgi:hypothetical protein